MSTSVGRSREEASPLQKRELVWRDRYGILESHGYRLRQRYKPDWKPSWLTTKRPPPLHDDYKPNSSSVTIDAVRISDGRRVFLKRVPASSSELTILRFLSEKEKLRDPCNHTAPLLDEFPEDSSFTYMVMPFLRPYDFPEFFSIDEIVDFVKQVLEGIVYMHGLHIAHRDCSDLNIMMDPEPLYPRGLHPTNMNADATGYRPAHPKRRRDVQSVRYYFIDFGISTMFSPDNPDKTVMGLQGQDDEVPELSDSKPYDPFLVDVFILGNLFKKAFYKKYENMSFLDPLIDDMTQRSPRTRCTAAEALKIFNEIVSRQSQTALRWRLKTMSSGRRITFLQDVDSISRECVLVARNLISSSSTGVIQFLRRSLGLGVNR